MRFLTKLMLIVLVLALLPTLTASAQQSRGTPKERYDAATKILLDAGIDPRYFGDVSSYLRQAALSGNSSALPQQLSGLGLSPEQIQLVTQPQNTLQIVANVNASLGSELLFNAAAILGQYNLTPTQVLSLAPYAADPLRMAEELGKLGLSPEQTQNALGQLTPLLQEAAQTGVTQLIPIELMGTALMGIGVSFSTEESKDLIAIWNDPTALQAYFEGRNLSPQQVQGALAILEQSKAQGVTPDLLSHNILLNAENSLQKLGLPAEALHDLADLSGDPAALRAYLEGLGLEGTALDIAMFDALPPFFARRDGSADLGSGIVDDDFVREAQSRELEILAEKAGLDAEALADLLSVANDPEALANMLAAYGVEGATADQFMADFSRTSFGRSMPSDPDDYAALSDDMAETVLSDDRSDDSASGGDASGNDDSGNDDSGGDNSGSDDSGGGDDDGGGGDN